MMRPNSFSTYHPMVNFSFFTVVIVCSMLLLHPFFLAVSILSSFLFALRLNGWKAIRFTLGFGLPLFAAVALLNPVFSHAGFTILFYVRNNPITLESILFGIASGGMVLGMLLWFSCYNTVMDSEKFIYLFGRFIPVIALLISMTLRFVPKLKGQLDVIRRAQSGFENGLKKSVIGRARSGIRHLSILITWALEDAVETSDSMKARGYGLSGRTSFSLYTLEKRDILCLCVMGGLLALLILGMVTDACYFQYYPFVKGTPIHPLSIAMMAGYTVFCFLPITLEALEDYKWRTLTSKT